MSFFAKLRSIIIITTARTILVVLILMAAYNQVVSTIRPLVTATSSMGKLLTLTEHEKLRILAPSYSRLIDAVNAYPQGTRLYFVPCFEDSGNSGFWWWHLYLLTRYEVYPRKVLCHDELLYEGQKSVYLSRWIGHAKYFNDIKWIRDRGIEYVILVRHNSANILPVTAEVSGL